MNSEGFEDLEVFRRAYQISLEIHRLSLKLPKIEQFGLGEQMRRASKSIAANIAEGYAKRRSQPEFNRFIHIAIGSADEMRVWVRYCLDLGYIDVSQWEHFKTEYSEIAKMLNGLSKSVVSDI